MLKQRILTSLAGLPVLLVAIWFNGPWFMIVAAAWGLGSVLEFLNIAKNNRIPVFTSLGALWVLLLIVYPYFPPHYPAFFNTYPLLDMNHFIPLLLTAAIIFSFVYFVIFYGEEHAFSGWVWTIGGIIYVGWTLSYFVILRSLQSSAAGMDFGRNWVFLALLATFASDSAAYFAGKSWGKHHLAPHISPKKTWEGSVAGVVGAVVVCLLFTLPTPLQLPLLYWQAVLLGILVSVFGQIGDLAESLFKRSMGVKDASNHIPGHGGFLDRMDSIAFAGIVVYYYVIWIIPHL